MQISHDCLLTKPSPFTIHKYIYEYLIEYKGVGIIILALYSRGKDQAIPLQARSGPEG